MNHSSTAVPSTRRRRATMSGLPLLLAVLVAGCASTSAIEPAKDNFVAKDVGRPPAGALVILLPRTDEDKHLARGEELLVEQLRAALTQSGYRVAMLQAANYATIWQQEVDAVGGIYDPTNGQLKTPAYGQALSQLARRVCDEAKCSLLLRHRLVIRTAELDRQVARWDGQERRFPLATTAGSQWTFSGQTPALSVELLAMSADGRLAFRTYGGASLPFAADVAGAKAVLRPDLFDRPAELADGVRIALRPALER
jgi:hypothetical protein